MQPIVMAVPREGIAKETKGSPSRMRILQIAPPWFTVPPTGYGGIEAIVARLCDGLVERGHEVTLVASGGSHTAAELVSPFGEPPSALLGDVATESAHTLAAYALREGFDVIHDHSGFIGPVLASQLDGPPVVHTLHGPWTATNGPLYARLGTRIHLVSISEDQARRAPREVHLAAVVPNGIDLREMPLRTDAPTDDGYLLFVGRANVEKGPVHALEVARRTGRRLKMMIKVNEQAERDYWRQEIEPLLAEVDVELQVDRGPAFKAELFAGAAATLCPLQWEEPFGLVMVESMAAGTPVIAYRRGAAQDLIDDGRTGYLIDPDDLEAMCDAVGRVTTIAPQDCRDRVERNYSALAMVRGYEAVYSAAIEAGRSDSIGAPVTSIRRSGSEHSTHNPSVVRIPESRALAT